jgi:spermidine synthase
LPRKKVDWLIVELGDGQVAGLPENVETRNFYEALSLQVAPQGTVVNRATAF